jgi:hypothetical protein
LNCEPAGHTAELVAAQALAPGLLRNPSAQGVQVEGEAAPTAALKLPAAHGVHAAAPAADQLPLGQGTQKVALRAPRVALAVPAGQFRQLVAFT